MGEIMELAYGSGLPETKRSGEGHPVYGSNGIVGFHEEPLLHGPGIVVGRKGTVGAVIWSESDFWPIDTTYYAVPKDNSNLKWLYFLLKSLELSRLDSSTGVPGLNRNDAYQLPIKRPPEPEQSKIAGVLSEADEAIGRTEAIIAKLKRIKQGLMQDLLTKGIDEHGNIRSEKTHKFKDSPLGRIPEEWEVPPIEILVERSAGSIKIGPFGSQLKKEYLTSSGFKVYGQENAFRRDFAVGTRFVDKRRFRLLRSCELKPGDFVISMMGTIGKCAIVPHSIEPGIMDSHLLRLRLNPKRILNEYLLHILEEADFVKSQMRQLSVGGIMEGLSSKIVRSIILPLPNLEEQQRIVLQLGTITRGIETETQVVDKLQRLKQGLMQDLLSGKVRVTPLLEKV